MAWLVTVEVALTLVLLAGAGLMARSLLTLSRADRIVDPAGMTAIQIFLPESRYASAEQSLAFLQTLDERIASTAPGLAAARASRPRSSRRRAANSRSTGTPPPTTALHRRWASSRFRTTTSRSWTSASSAAARSPTVAYVKLYKIRVMAEALLVQAEERSYA